MTTRAEITVIGSGPGGAITAGILAEAGRDVVLLEEGPHLPLESCEPFTLDEMQQKYRNRGMTVALGRVPIVYVEGQCVGGGSEINSGLYHRTPSDVLAEWRQQFQVEALTDEDLRPHFEACERDLFVSRLAGPAPGASLKLQQGAQKLGWSCLEVPRWFRNSEKQSMTRTFIPRALKAGCRLLVETRVTRLRRQAGRWRIETRPPLEIEAESVFVCGGAVQTPALLRRSGIKRNVGNSLKMHPTIKVVARFPDEVNAPGMGVPVHQVKQFAPRYSFGCSISSRPHLALAMTDHLQEVDNHWRQMASYYAMTRGGSGTVRALPGFRDPLVRYRLDAGELTDMAEALRKLSECLFAAGAVALYPSVAGMPCLRSPDDLAQIPATLPRDRTDLMTIHLFSSCPMGENRQCCATDSYGRVHGVPGLYVADASLLWGAPGVNPQGSIMALARRNALRFLEEL